MEEKIDIRSIQADLYGLSRKSVNQLLNKGLLANPIEKLRKGGTILLIGNSNNIEETSQNVLNFGNYDTFTTSISEVDESYLPIFKRMLDDSKLNTVIFPSSASVPILIKALEKTDFLTIDMVKELEIYCLGNQTMDALLTHNIQGAEQTKEATIPSLVCTLVNKSDS
jgi:uroporphyrinogen III methyltransferase/synthase